MAKLNLNPADFEGINDGAPEILPVGDYTMQIVQSEMRATKAGDGEYLWLEFEILGPKYAGRKFWERLNLFNKNEATVKVAKKQLAAITAEIGRAHSELQSLMRISYAVFCLKKKNNLYLC